MQTIYDMLIIGGGPAGYTAALYAVRAGLRALVLEKLCAGGQMALTERVDNYPAFEQGIDGFTLGEKMRQTAERFGAETTLAEVTALALDGRIKRAESTEGCFFGRTVVLATGAALRTLGLPREKELAGHGVHYCAACDGQRYRGKTAVVIGGGNSAVTDALTLSKLCEKVIVVHRRDRLRADRIYQAALSEAKNTALRCHAVPTALLGGERLTGIRLRDVRTDREEELACDGVFFRIGSIPATQLVQGQLTLDASGYVIADETTQTALSGVFAAGDVRTKAVRQIVTAVADGASAAHYAAEYLARRLL